MKPIVRVIVLSTIICLLMGYVIGSAVLSSRTVPTLFDSVVMDIVDRDTRLYLTEDELYGMIKSEKDVQRIEEIIRSHSMVRTAECYQTTDRVLHVRVEQRVPLLRVITGSESYFVDRDYRRMPVRESVKDPVLLAEGRIGERMAVNELAKFAEWLQTNDYWRERIARVTVRDVRHVEIVQKDAEPRILLGPIDGYKEKLNRVRTFNTEGLAKMADRPTYKELDVQYNGQVVGR